MVTRRTFVKAAVATPLLAGGLSFAPGVGAQAGPVRVGSKDFPESIIIGEMYALLLEGAGLQVERKLNLGGTAVAHEALLSGDLDVYPEYTGTGLLVVLEKTLADVPGLESAAPAAGATPAATDAVDAVYQYVRSEYQTQFNLAWLDQTPMNDSQALAVTRQFAEEHGLTTISQLVALASSVDLVISLRDGELRDAFDRGNGDNVANREFSEKVQGIA